MTFETREAIASDEPFLREMLYLALYVRPGDPPISRAVLDDPAIARYVTGWGRGRGDRGWIAVVDGVPVGAAWVRQFSEAEPGYGFVDERTPELSVAILPDYRGNGIGTQLIEQLLRELASVSLSCDPDNPAVRLYRRLGFQAHHERVMVRR